MEPVTIVNTSTTTILEEHTGVTASDIYSHQGVTTDDLFKQTEETSPPTNNTTPKATNTPAPQNTSSAVMIIRGSTKNEQSTYSNQGSCTMFGTGSGVYFFNPITLKRFADPVSCETATLNNADKNSEAYANAKLFLGK